MTGKKNQNNILFAFFGTPRMSVNVLDALDAHGYVPALVVTAPDKPANRGQNLTSSPAKSWAQERGIDVLTPDSLKDEAFVAELANTDWDVFIVAAYGKLIPKAVLGIPRRGSLNVHPSLLPKFRGPSPVMSAILADERTTGVSIMEVVEKMDAGPVVAQARVEISPQDWPLRNAILEEMLATEGGNLLAEVLPEWVAGTVQAEPQDEALATYTQKFTDEDARLDISSHEHAQKNLLKIRAFDRSPRAYFVDESGKRVIVTDAEIEDGKLEILRVIPEGKKEMDFSSYRESRG